MKLKTLLLGTIAFIIGFFIFWIALIFPYPSLTKQQLAITKHDLIEGILKREIILRKQYAKVNNIKFVVDDTFRKKIDEERKKFYKYCNNGSSLNYRGKYCEISKEMSLFDLNRYTTYTIKYKFDSKSKTFFNYVKTYMAHKTDDNRSIFWIPEKKDNLLYLVKITGYDAHYGFFNNEKKATYHLLGIPNYQLGSIYPIEKDDLIFIGADVHFKCREFRRNKNCWVIFSKIRTYITKGDTK